MQDLHNALMEEAGNDKSSFTNLVDTSIRSTSEDYLSVRKLEDK